MESGPSTPKSTRSQHSSYRSRLEEDRNSLIEDLTHREERTHLLLAEVLARLDELGPRTPYTRVLEDPTHDCAKGTVAPLQGARTCPTLGHLGTTDHSLGGIRRSERLARRPKVSYREDARQRDGPALIAPDFGVRISSSTAPLSAGPPEPRPQGGFVTSEKKYHQPLRTQVATNCTRAWGVDRADSEDGTVGEDGMNEIVNEDRMNELVDEDRIHVINEKMTDSQKVIEQIGEVKQNSMLDRTEIKYCDKCDNSDAEMINDSKHKMFKRDDEQKMMKCDSDKHVTMLRSEHKPHIENYGMYDQLVEYEGMNEEILGREKQTSGPAERWNMPPVPKWTWRTASRIRRTKEEKERYDISRQRPEELKRCGRVATFTRMNRLKPVQEDEVGSNRTEDGATTATAVVRATAEEDETTKTGRTKSVAQPSTTTSAQWNNGYLVISSQVVLKRILLVEWLEITGYSVNWSWVTMDIQVTLTNQRACVSIENVGEKDYPSWGRTRQFPMNDWNLKLPQTRVGRAKLGEAGSKYGADPELVAVKFRGMMTNKISNINNSRRKWGLRRPKDNMVAGQYLLRTLMCFC